VFEWWGRFVCRHAAAVAVISSLVLGVAAAGLRQGGSLSTATAIGADVEAQRAAQLMDSEIQGQVAPGSTALLVFHSRSWRVEDPEYRSALERSLEPLRADPRIRSIVTPYSVSPQLASQYTSRDGHEALVELDLRDDGSVAATYFGQLRGEVRSDRLEVLATGEVPISAGFTEALSNDLERAERISLPVSLLLLVLVFGSLVAALLPAGLGGLAVLGAIGGVLLLARWTEVSSYSLNLVAMIGLGVSIDYSLFLVSRFREELRRTTSIEDALAVTEATAGRAVFFSGITLAAGISALVFYQGTFLASLGAAGAITAAIAVFCSMTLLPALLALLGRRVDLLQLPLPAVGPWDPRSPWGRISVAVMRRPVAVLVPTLGLLLALAAPFASIRLATGDATMLPPHWEVRRGYDRLVSDFPGYEQSTLTVVVRYPGGSPLGGEHVGELYDLSRRLEGMPGVVQVSGPFTADPRLTRDDYARLYAQAADRWPPELRAAMAGSLGRDIVVLGVTVNQPANSDAARQLLARVRAESVPRGQVLVTGQTAFDVDTIDYMRERTPVAAGFVVACTLLTLLLLTGSFVLPVKAVLSNLMSMTAAFGALVFVFQQGHLSSQLDFTPQSIDPVVPVMMFATVFGLSMDYEVLLVSRIQEFYRLTGDRRAVAVTLQSTGRLITGAAAIMVAVFSAFALGDVLVIKALGIGLAIAVALDATIVRALVVPSVMCLLGDLNWWAPAPVQRLLTGWGLVER
jgi:putative drug exporter of the RND superfamily